MATGPQTPGPVRGDRGVPGPGSHPEADAGSEGPGLNSVGGTCSQVCPGQGSSSVRDSTLAVWGCLCLASWPPQGHTWPSPTGPDDSRSPLFSPLILEVATGGGRSRCDGREGELGSRPWRAGRAGRLQRQSRGWQGPDPPSDRGSLKPPHRRGGGWGRRGRPRPSITGPGPGVRLLRARPLPLPAGSWAHRRGGATPGRRRSPRGPRGPAR